MLRFKLRSRDCVNSRWMSFQFVPLWRWIRTATRVASLLVGSASIPVVVLAEQNDTQTGVTGTEAADVLAVSEAQDAEAEVSTSSGDTLNATATGIDALGGGDTVSNTAGLTTDASASASLTSQPKETKANATSTGVSAGEGDDQVTSSSTFTSTANAFGVYAGNLQFTPEQGAPPPKEINVSITTTGKATGVVTGDGADTVNNDALFAVTALATSGGTADQLNSTVRESVNVKSKSSSEASAKGIETGEGNDSVTNGGVMLNTATATSGALAIGLVAPQGTPTPDPQNPTAPPKPKKTQIKADASATAKADAVGIDADEDEEEDSSEDTSPFGLDGLRITYQKTVTNTGGDDTITNSVLLTNLATATSGAGSGTISDKVDGTVAASATSEATANSTGITAGTGNDTVTNSGELMSAATATAGALSLSLEVGTPSDTTPAPAPAPGQPPKPKAPTEDKENKASSKTNVTATAKAIGIDVAGSGQTVAETGLAEISDGALVVNYDKTVTLSSDNDTVSNQGAIQALGTATAASQNASVVISSGGSTDAESKSSATSYGAGILTGAGNDSITNSGILTSSATSDASALTLGLAVGKAQETAPPAGGGSTTPPTAAPSKLATSTDTSVTAEAEAFGIDAEGKPTTTTLTRRLSIGLSGLGLSQGKTESGGAGDDTILNNGIVTSTATASADSTDAAIEMEAAGSVSSESEATAKANSMGIYTGAGNDTITNNVLLTAGATATADALSVGLVVSKPPEQAPAGGTPTPPPTPDPNAKKDKSNVKVKAGATAQANAAGIDAEGAGHNTTENKSLTIGGNALEYTTSSSNASATGRDTIVNRFDIDVDATATSGAIAAGIAIQAAGSVDADATSKASATSSGIATGGDADRVDNSFLLQSDANATATALGLAVSVTQPTDSSGTKPSTLEAMQDTYSTARSAANAAAESHATGVDTESGANNKEESSTFRIGFDGLLRRQTDNVTSLAGNDEVTNSGAMLVTSNSLVGAAAIDVKLESEGTAASEAKADARAASDGVLTGGGSDVVLNSGEFLSSATATAGALATTVAIGATPGASTTPAPAPGQPRKPAAPSANKENKASSNTTVTANARATGIDAEGPGQSQTSESTFQISLAGRSLTKNEQKQVNSAAGNDSVTNQGALQAISTALAGSRNADIAISSSGSLSAESKVAATSESGAIAAGGGDDAINNSGLLTSAATARGSAVTLGLAIGKPQETTPPAGGGGSGTPPTTTQAPSKLTTSTETSVDARASAYGIDAEGKGTNTTSNRNLEISFEGLRLARSSSESSNAGNDQVLNDGIVTATATASADSRDAAVVLDAVGSVNSESAASAKAATTGIYTGGGNDTITSNGGLSARATATADALSLGVTVSKPPEQAAGGSGGGGGTTPPAPAKKDKSNVKVDVRATSEASATAIDAEGSQHDQSRSASLNIGGNELGLTLQRSHSSAAGADTVVNRGIIDADAEATSGALAAGIAVNAAGSIDVDATSKAKAASSAILTGGGADLVDNTFLVRSEADATATALAVAVSVSQPTDSTGAKPSTLDKLKDIFATAHSVANAEAESSSTGIDTEGDAHVQQETLTIGNGGDGRLASYVAETTSLAGDDVVRNSGAVIVSAGSLAGAGAAEVKVETEGTASSQAKADAKAKTGAVLTGGGNDAVTNSGALTSTATATAGALAVSFTKTGGLGAQAKSDARALSDARAIGIGADAEEESRRTEVALTLNESGVELSFNDASNASSGADTIANAGLISSIAAATSGAAGAAITMDGSASSDVDAVAKARATTIDAGGGADVIGNDGFLDAVAVSTSNALSVAFGQKGDEKTSKSKEKAEASSTAESTATGIAGDSGTNTLTEASLEITLDSLTVSLSREAEAASGNDVISNRGGVLAAATATSGAEGASIAIDGVAKADINATAKSRAVAIDGGGGNDAILNVGEVGAAAISTAGTVAAAVGQKTSSQNSARTKVSANTVAEAAATGITTDGDGRRELDAAELVIDETGLAINLSTSTETVSGNDVLENRNSVSSTATATTGTLSVALTIKGAANAAANSSATANSLALDTGGGADVVLNRGTLTADAISTAATANAAISTEGRAISNSGLMGAGTTAKSRAVGISTTTVEETKSVEIEESIDFTDIGVDLRIEIASDGLSADGNDVVTNTGDITVTSDAQAPRLNIGVVSGTGVAVSMGKASSEAYAGGIDTGHLDDTIDNRGTLSARATSTAVLANVAVSGKGLAVAANAVWDGGTEAEAVATGINADSGNRTTTVIAAEADTDLARVRYNKDVESASGDDQVTNSGAITSFARAEAPSLNVGVVSGTGVAAAVSTSTATAESTAIRGGDGDDGLDNSGELSSIAEAFAATANVAVTNQGVAAAADAVWDGGTKATATAIGIAGDGGDRTRSTFIAVGTDETTHESTSVLADGVDTITNSGAIGARSSSTALSAGVAVVSTGVGIASATSTSTSRATAIDAGAGTAVDDVYNSGRLTAVADALAAAASVSVTNSGLAVSADAIFDGGTKADARARGIDVGAGAETVTNDGAIDATATSTTASAAVSVAISGVAGAVATSTGKADATAIDASAGNDTDLVTNSAELRATANSLAASAAVSATNSGVAVAADAVWDGGTGADARARGIDVGEAADTIDNSGDITATGTATAASLAASVALSGVAGTISTSTATSDVAAIDAGNDAVRDEVSNSGDLTATSTATANTAAVSFTMAGVALAADTPFDGGTGAEATARGINVGLGADDIMNTGDVEARADATARSAAVAVAVSGVAGAIAKSTSTANAVALDAGDGADDDDVANSGLLTAISDAAASSAAVSFTAAGVAVAGGSAWDGGTRSDSRASGMVLGAGIDEVTNDGAVNANATARSTGIGVSVAVEGVAGAITAAIADATAVGIDAAAGNDVIVSRANIDAASLANANTISAAGTKFGVSVAGNNSWDGGTTSNARSTGISGGAGLDTLTNSGNIESTADAVSPSVAVSFTVGGVAAAVSTARSTADAGAIDGGDDADDIDNSGALTVTADSDAVAVSVAVTGAGVGLAADSVWDGGTTARAQAGGIRGGAGNDDISNTTGGSSIDAIANSTATSVAGSVTGGGFAGSISTSTAIAESAAIDGGDGDDNVFSDSRVLARADARGTSLSVSIVGSGIAVASDAFWDGGTKGNATSAGIAGGAGDDDILNAGAVTAEAESESTSAAVAASQSPSFGLAAAIAASTSTARATALDAGAGTDELTNEGLLRADSSAAADGVSVSFTPFGGAITGSFDAATRADAFATGMAGAGGGDTLVNAGGARLELESTAETRNLAVSLTLAGVSLADANAISTADGIGIDGGADADVLRNEGLISGTIDSEATSRALTFATGLSSASANSTGKATGAALVGGAGDDRIENLGNVDLAFNATARGQSLGGSQLGVALSDASADSVVDAAGQRGDAGADTMINAGTLRIDAGASTTARSISAAQLGVSLASANSTATSRATGLAGGDANDVIVNVADGEVDVLARANVNAGSVAIAVAGATQGEARTSSAVSATGLAGDAGDDTIGNAGLVRVRGLSESVATGGSVSVAGAARARAGTEVETQATGISGGAGSDTIVNSGTLLVGPEDDDQWMSRLATGAASIGFAGDMDAQSAAFARTTSTGIDGGNDNDRISNTGDLSVTANARSDSGTGALTIFGSASGGGESGAFTRAAGLDGAAGDDQLDTLGTLSVTAQSRLAQTGTSFTFGGSGELGAALVASTEASGVNGGEGNDQIRTAGTITVNADSLLTSSGGGDTIFGTSAAAGTSGATTRAVGIDSEAGDDRIDSAADMSIAATSELTMDNASYTFGGSGATGGTLVASTSVEAVLGGAGRDVIANSGALTIDALSTLTSSNGSDTTFGGASSSVTSGGRSEARGLAGGDGDDIIENRADGSIVLAATTRVNANAVAYTFLGGGSQNDAVLTGGANAVGMAGDAGSDTLVNRGEIRVLADASLVSRGGAKTTVTATSDVASTGVSDVAAQALGMVGGDGDDAIESSGLLQVNAIGVAEARNEASNNGVSLLNNNVAGAVTRSDVEATGFAAGVGANRTDIDGDATVTATSTAYALALSSGATVSFGSDGESRVRSAAEALATGALAEDGNDAVNIDGSLTVTADATTAKRVLIDVTVFRDFRSNDENDNPSAPIRITDAALPPLTDESGNRELYPPCTEQSCTVVFWTQSPPEEQDPNNPSDVDGGHYIVVVETDDSDPPVERWRWDWVDAGLIQRQEIQEEVDAFPTYAAANGNGLTGRGFATASGTAEATARGVKLGEGDNSVQNRGALIVRADAEAVVNVSSDGDGTGDAEGRATTSATAHAVGIELGNGNDQVLNAGEINVTAVSTAQSLATVTGGDICIWFFGWWCGGGGDGIGTANATLTTSATGIAAGGGTNRIVNDGDITVLAGPEVRLDSRNDAYVADVRQENLPQTIAVTSSSRAIGIETGDGDDEIINNGSLSVEARDLASACDSGCQATPTANQVREDSVTAAGIVTGAGNDIVRNAGSLSALIVRNDVATATLAIDTGTGDDELSLGDGSSTIGNVRLGEGDDTLMLSGTPVIEDAGGTLINVDAGIGTDTLVLSGAGAYTGTPLSIERAAKIGAGTYTLSSLVSMQSLTIDEGTLQVDSDYQFDPNGTYSTFFQVTGASGLLDVNGSATLGGSIEVEKRGRTYVRDGSRYTVVQSSEGLEEAFDTISLPESRRLLSFSLEQSPGVLDVVADAASFTTVTENPHLRQIATNLDRIAPTGTGDLDEVFGTLQSMDGDFDQAFASLSPEGHLATASDTLVNVRQMTTLLQGHLSDSRALYRYAPQLQAPSAGLALTGGSGGIGSLQLSSAPRAFAAGSSDGFGDMLRFASAPAGAAGSAASATGVRPIRSQIWMLGLSADSESEAVGGYSPFETESAGYLLGYDMHVGEQWIVGANVGHAATDVTLSDGTSRGDIDAWLGSAFATWFGERAYLEAGLSYGEQSFENTRMLVVGPIERRTYSEHDGNAWTAFAGGGYAIGTKLWSLEPYASLSYFYVEEEPFEETGADSLGQIVAGRSTEALFGEAGASLSLLQRVDSSFLDWHLSIALGYDFDVDQSRITYAYAGAPGTAFTIDDRDSARRSTVFGGGVSWLTGQSTLSLDYGARSSADHDEQFVSARMTVRF